VLSKLDQLRALLIQIENLGLTSVEFNASRTVLLSRIRPQALSQEQFISAIMDDKKPAGDAAALNTAGPSADQSQPGGAAGTKPADGH
jgi:hypothetical protein